MAVSPLTRRVVRERAQRRCEDCHADEGWQTAYGHTGPWRAYRACARTVDTVWEGIVPDEQQRPLALRGTVERAPGQKGTCDNAHGTSQHKAQQH